MLTITDEEIITILENNDDGIISFDRPPFNLMVDTIKGISVISVSGIVLSSDSYFFIGQYYPTWGKYYNAEEEALEDIYYTFNDVYLNKEDAQEMIQYLKSFF